MLIVPNYVMLLSSCQHPFRVEIVAVQTLLLLRLSSLVRSLEQLRLGAICIVPNLSSMI